MSITAEQIIPDLLSDKAKKLRFDRLCAEALRVHHEQGLAGIGTMQERRLHAIVKTYLCADTDCHEVGVKDTRYVSDVRVGNHIYEVQTGAFYPMRAKMEHYLNKTDCEVTVVHPIAVDRQISVVSADGNLSKPRKSPQHGRLEDLLPELYGILPSLGNPRLHFRVLLLDVWDFRQKGGTVGGKRRRSVRFDRIPTRLIEDVSFQTPKDFLRLLPSSLPSPFTVKEFSLATKIRGLDAYSAVRALVGLGLLEQGEKVGRSMTFRRLDLPNCNT